ncbi:MAG TPA: GNAT family N-acetyltransferase, partial [Planctomycetaceae bacterium]|nr:GNAT family N-acetyltransferase [Planctomycetaceae bacterium]
NWDLNTKLSNYGADILPLSGHFLRAQKKASAEGTDFNYTGDVSDVNIIALQQATAQFYLPVIPPLGIGPRGRLYILDPNQVALEVATRLHARKLIILSSENGDLKKQLKTRQMTTKEMRAWLQKHPTLQRNTRLQLQALVQAGERGVERCHFIDSSIDGALLVEILTSGGIGIMITDSSYQYIRSARLSDIPMIAEILEKPLKDLAVVHKSIAYLEQHIENFLVFCIDEDVVGCCEIVDYHDNHSMEISGLAVRESHRNRGIGKKLVEAALEQARKENRRFVFALTTQTAQFFKRMGFKELSPEQLPPLKKENYDFQDSIILGRYLT